MLACVETKLEEKSQCTNPECRHKLAELEFQVAQLTKKIFGTSSEKMTPPKKEIEKKDGTKPDPEIAKRRRKKRNALRKTKAKEVKIFHALPEAERRCPDCLDQILAFAGVKETSIYEFVPAHFERQIHTQATWACPCCDYITTALGAQKPVEGGQYGAGFMGHVVVSKCADSIPFYRMEKQFTRIGIPLARSTLCNLFHQAANILEPIYKFMQSLVVSSLIVLADETPLRVLDKNRKKNSQGLYLDFSN